MKIKLNKKNIIFLISFLLLTFIITFLLNISSDIYTYQSPLIRINPEQLMLTLKNNEIKKVQFNISTTTSFLCRSSCEYDLIDRQTEKSITKGNFTLKKDQIAIINSNIQSPEIGTGKKIYNLEVTCKNKKDFLCYQTMQESKRSSFVILSHELTELEKEIKQNYKNSLLEAIDKINNLNNDYIQLYQNYNFIKKQLLESNDIDLKLPILNSRLEKSISFLNDSLQEWENQRYIYLSNYNMSDFSKDINNLDQEILLTNNDLKKLLNKQNNLTLSYNNLVNTFEDIVDNRFYLELNSTPDNLTLKFQLLNQLLKNITFNVANNEYIDLETYEYDIEILNKLLEDFLDKYNNFITINKNNKIEILSQIKLNRNRINETIEIDETNICNSLLKIINDDSFFKYKLKDNKIYFYNNSYYNSTGNLITCDEVLESCPFNTSEDKFILLNDSLYELNKTNIYINDFDEINNSYNLNCKKIREISNITYTTKKIIQYNISKKNETIFEKELIEPTEQCCLYNQCSQCCYDEACRLETNSTPLLLIHGHSVLKSTPADAQINSFNDIIIRLIEDGYIDAGMIAYDEPSTKDDLEWSYFASPLVAKASYYYDTYYSLGSYIYVTRKDDNIDTYAIRLSEIIKNYKKKTGKDKIDLIAHSMGGLVVRRYLQIFGTDSTNNVILIATPNHGIDGRISFFCPLFGGSLECDDMQEDSIFLSKLNDPYYVPDLNITTISARGCVMKNNKEGDGVVSLNSSLLDYANSYIINGTCSDFLETSLHKDLLKIDKYPEVYEIIKEKLDINS